MMLQRKTSALLVVALLAATAPAQNLLAPRPLDLWSGHASLSNPAAISYQRSMLQAGMRFYHLGFIEGAAARFRLNYISLVLPRWLPQELAFAAHAQNLSLPLYNQTYFSAAVSRRLSPLLAVGLKAGVLTRSYDQSEFVLLDANDPVFARGRSKSALDLGVGLTFRPLSFVSFAFSRDHLNQPNLALGQPALRLQAENHLALALHLGNVQTALINTRARGAAHTGGFVEWSRPELGFARFSRDQHGWQLEARSRLYGPLSLNYTFDYPGNELAGNTTGSHEFAFVLEFDRVLRLPRIEPAPQFDYPFTASPDHILTTARALVRAEAEEMQIVAQRLERVIAPDVPTHALAALSVYDLGTLDTTLQALPAVMPVNTVAFADTAAQLAGSYSTFYRQTLGQLSRSLLQTPATAATIVANPQTMSRALALKNYLGKSARGELQVGLPRFASVQDSLRFHRRLGRSALLPQEERVTLSPSAAVFQIISANFHAPPRRWELVVETAAGEPVWSLAGHGRLPNQMVWNWQKKDGRVVTPGYYHYYLTWEENNGAPGKSPQRRLYVRKLQRTVKIEVKRKLEASAEPADAIEVILHR
ncbi:MAG: type IX secretion system membrane protein PorP/SprF [candidate division KSB1 bacterium]|nr:type IX secretion system membrane protein PorP/SprF [candidate division KSB1 bacterium]MDZ7273122.1 type IX secretion system membrane protein PorP/SprF [candidate division KSB1 bacterium]MDZ7285224.1 type IX secretion system membrane protein PorP/SprF [candidate division KSB1 bacterium]MDZ7298256.1 type IX secretion system membrane protein PorP/SprF [candidate division KSB1 bacterium]MDZ7308269.1 type IX secretion system membrane protein PorP/SprF [candidate division KSB1 bacterium]